MAKAKESMQALVPVEEQPYEVPENWRWVHIGDVMQLQAGKNISAKDIYEEKDEEHPYPCYGGNGIRGYVKYYNQEGMYPLIGRQGALCGNTKYAIGQFYATEHAVVVTCPASIDTKWAYYILTQMNLNQYATATAQPGLAVGTIINVPIAVAPLPEQRRIVERIESLFAKLDEAKEKAQAVVDGFESRKAAILHKAFSGELTEGWRKENSISFDTWKNETIESFCSSLKYGTAKKSSPAGPVVVIRMGNLQQGEIDWSNLAYTDDAEDIEKYLLQPFDVLFNRTNSPELVGKTAIYRGEFPAIYAGYLIKLDYDHSHISGEYLNYMLNSSVAKDYCNAVKSDGVNQSNINAKKIGAFEMPVPSLQEQREIVHILNSLLQKEQQAHDAALAVLDRIDEMKKAILAKAFRGQLGTNVASEEPAVI